MINCKNIEISIHLEACNDENIYLFDKNKLVTKLEQLGYVDTFAFIYHNEEIDKGTTNHIHLMLQFKQTMALDRLEKDFALPNQCFEKIKGRWCNAIAYLTHSNRPEKHQYSIDKVVSNIDVEKVTKEALETQSERLRIEKLLLDYGECKITKRKLLDNINADIFHKYNAMYKHMVEYRQMKVRRRDMRVMYICGSSGSGKTTLAKFLAETNNFDYFVSGSGKDVLDGYDKEECIILDDLRASSFEKAELFKLLDNNTNSSVKSRYKNKDISFCKLLIITSIKSPLELYNWETCGNDVNESFKQFARRLGNRFFMINALDEVVAIKLEQNPFRESEWRQGEKIKSPITMKSVFEYFNIANSVDAIMGDILSNAINACNNSKNEKKGNE